MYVYWVKEEDQNYSCIRDKDFRINFRWWKTTLHPNVRQVACDDLTMTRGFLGFRAASLVTAYSALRPRVGFSYSPQEHMKDTYSVTS